MYVLIPLLLVVMLFAAFVVAMKNRSKVAQLDAVTTRLRREVDSLQNRLQLLEQGAAPAPAVADVTAAPPVDAAVPPAPAVQEAPAPAAMATPDFVPPAITISLDKPRPAAAPFVPPTPPAPPAPAVAPAPVLPNTPAWVRTTPTPASTPVWVKDTEEVFAKARSWLFTGNLVA